MRPFKRSFAGILALFALSLLAIGCQTELYSGLSEEEANKMLALLLAQDFDAVKVNQGKNGFAITVEKDRTTLALEILSANGLPRSKHESLGRVFSGQGMISTPTEEQARLSYALSQELSETFSRIDGVLTARVHVVLATRDQRGLVSSPASAAVFLRHLPDSPVVNLTTKIKEISAKSVPGLLENDVAVMLVPSRVDIVIPPDIEGGIGGAKIAIIILILAIVAFGINLTLKRRKKSKSQEA
jgi:type III secretion protein J